MSFSVINRLIRHLANQIKGFQSIHPSIHPWAQHPLVSNVPSLPHWVSFWAIGTGSGQSGVLGFRPCWCPLPIPLSPISRCFYIHSSPASGFHSCFFFTADVSAPIRSTLHLQIGRA